MGGTGTRRLTEFCGFLYFLGAFGMFAVLVEVTEDGRASATSLAQDDGPPRPGCQPNPATHGQTELIIQASGRTFSFAFSVHSSCDHSFRNPVSF